MKEKMGRQPFAQPAIPTIPGMIPATPEEHRAQMDRQRDALAKNLTKRAMREIPLEHLSKAERRGKSPSELRELRTKKWMARYGLRYTAPVAPASEAQK